MAGPGDSTGNETPFVSTGSLSPPERVQFPVAEAHERFRSNTDGSNSAVYPALARVSTELFGICVLALIAPKILL